MVDKHGISVFHWAALRGHLQLCKTLFMHARDDRQSVHNEVSPKNKIASRNSMATSHSQSDSFSKLEIGKELGPGNGGGGQENRGATALHYSAYSGNAEVFWWLHAHMSLSVNARDLEGASPAHYAAIRGHTKLLTELLRSRRLGSLDSHVDKNGATLLHYAALGGHTELCKLLQEHDEEGCLFNQTTNEGLDAAAYALTHGHTDVAHYIKETKLALNKMQKKSKRSGSVFSLASISEILKSKSSLDNTLSATPPETDIRSLAGSHPQFRRSVDREWSNAVKDAVTSAISDGDIDNFGIETTRILELDDIL